MTFPRREERLRLSEYPEEGTSDSRELEALWAIRDGRLYLLAISVFRFDGFAPRRVVGLRDLMPDRIQEGQIFTEWFNGSFELIERERVDRRLSPRADISPSIRVLVRKFHVANDE